MRLLYGLYTFSLVHLLNIISTSALPSHVSSQAASPFHIPISRSKSNLIDPHAANTIPATLVKRTEVDEYIGGGWSQHYNTLDMCQHEADVARSEIVRFYNQILEAGERELSNLPPGTFRQATMGGIQLVFRGTQPISWEFMKMYIRRAIVQAHAIRGNYMMTSYKLVLVNAIGGAVVVIQLILPLAGVA